MPDYTAQPGDTLATKDSIPLALDAPPLPELPDPAFERYTVQSGDTLAAIAQHFYGDSSEYAWLTIHDANRDVIGPDPTRIEPGMILEIPPYQPSLIPPIPPTIPVVGPDSPKYTVQSGDTLAAIAQRFYGDGSVSAWRYIYYANSTIIGPDPARIEPGMILAIPMR